MMKNKKSDDNQLKVFIANRESKCDECAEDLGHHAWIVLRGEKGAACQTCADLDHLVFLPSGDTSLTRRSHKHSRLSAVVLKWSRARKGRKWGNILNIKYWPIKKKKLRDLDYTAVIRKQFLKISQLR